MHDVDNTIHVTHAYRIGQTNNKSKQRPIIASLGTEKQKYAAVKQAYRLNRSTKFQNAFISEDICHDFKISRLEQLSKYKEMKQQYRSICFRGTELIVKNKKQSVIKSNTADHSATVAKPAQSPVPVINKRQPQDSNRQLTPLPPSPVLYQGLGSTRNLAYTVFCPYEQAPIKTVLQTTDPSCNLPKRVLSRYQLCKQMFPS